MEIKNSIEGLKEESKIYEREILGLLLEVSKSFSTGEMTREKREENFKKIDELREKVKDIYQIIDDIEKSKFDCVYKDEKLKTDIKEEEIEIGPQKETLETEKEVVEDLESGYTLDNVECLSKEEKIPEDENIDNNDNNYDEDKDLKINDAELTEEDLDNIDKVIENMDTTNKLEGNVNKEDKLEEDKLEENKEEEDTEQKLQNTSIEQMSATDAIEKIDRLIKEAKELNNNVIKFPEEKVVRRNRSRQYEELEEIEETDLDIENANINFDYNQETYDKQNYDIEPVPVLFGNRRAQNQMIVRKKSNGFSDKLKSLIFKIKLMLGGEDEEEN